MASFKVKAIVFPLYFKCIKVLVNFIILHRFSWVPFTLASRSTSSTSVANFRVLDSIYTHRGLCSIRVKSKPFHIITYTTFLYKSALQKAHAYKLNECVTKKKKNQLLILYFRIHILVMSNFQINIKCKHQAISVLEVNAEYYLFISKRGRVH